MNERLANWLVVLFFAVVIGVVFQQVYTSMTEQGIASGGPYDNAAAYPRAVAIIIGVLVVLHTIASLITGRSQAGGQLTDRPDHKTSGFNTTDQQHPGRYVRPTMLLLIFALYLGVLPRLGYHLCTTPMLMGIMLLCGVRKPLVLIGSSLGIAFVLAFVFEKFLKIVLPGGVFALNILW
ncbi:MAG: tripartite tricarboxylate transporter TctB family protein [Granulosicoccus sp.]